MPTWNLIQSQLRHINNPVVFLDVSIGNTGNFKLFNLFLYFTGIF